MLRSIGLAVVIALTLLPLVAEAQFGGVRRIGFLGAAGPGVGSPDVLAFRHGLRDLGWVDGQTLTIEYRWAQGHPERLPALARELVALKVDVIVTAGTVPIRAAKDATETIPIVFVVLVDPVATGLVTSFARPGGNATGWASQFEELVTKQPQLMKEALPGLSRLVLLARVESSPTFVGRAEAAARELGLTVRSLRVGGVDQYESSATTSRPAGSCPMAPASPRCFGVRRATSTAF